MIQDRKTGMISLRDRASLLRLRLDLYDRALERGHMAVAEVQLNQAFPHLRELAMAATVRSSIDRLVEIFRDNAAFEETEATAENGLLTLNGSWTMADIRNRLIW